MLFESKPIYGMIAGWILTVLAFTGLGMFIYTMIDSPENLRGRWKYLSLCILGILVGWKLRSSARDEAEQIEARQSKLVEWEAKRAGRSVASGDPDRHKCGNPSCGFEYLKMLPECPKCHMSPGEV